MVSILGPEKKENSSLEEEEFELGGLTDDYDDGGIIDEEED